MQNDRYKGRLIGENVLGPLLFGFVRRIKEFADEENPEKIIFLSRDGMIMKKAFDIMYKKEYQTIYAYASRRALTVPLLWMCSELDQVEKYIHFHRNISVGKIFEKLGLEMNDYQDILENNGLNKESIITEAHLYDNKRFVDTYRTIRNDIEENARYEYPFAKRYWQAIIGNSKSCFVVDIGWSGSSQNAIQLLIGTRKSGIQIHGIYLGTIPYNMYSNKMDGYLCSFCHDQEVFTELLDYMSVVELLFSSEQPSVKKYGKHGVEFYDSDYKEDESMLIDERILLSEIHEGALMFLTEAVNSGIQLSDDECKSGLFNLGTKPSLQAAELIGDCRTYDYEMAYIARPKSGRFNSSEYGIVSWKNGYMRRCFPSNCTYRAMKRFAGAVRSFVRKKK